MAKLIVAAREGSKGQIAVASGSVLESRCRPGVCAHYLPLKDTDGILYYLQMCTLNSWESTLGSNTWEDWIPWKLQVQSPMRNHWRRDQLPDLFLFTVASWRDGEALFRTKNCPQEESESRKTAKQKCLQSAVWMASDTSSCPGHLAQSADSSDSSSKMWPTAWPVCQYNSRA